MKTSLLSAIIGSAVVLVSVSCTTTGNAKKEEKMEYDYVAGNTGGDKVIVKDDNAIVHSDRDAVNEYTRTVDTINNQRQLVESDLVGLNKCRQRRAEEKGVAVSDGPLSVDCMEDVVNKRDRAGNDLVQVDGKLVLRKKDDFKTRYDEAKTCLDQMIHVRDMARKSYNLEGCDK
jgi:hypothetical protein